MATGKDSAGQPASFRSEFRTRETTVEVIPMRRYVTEALFERVRIEMSRGAGTEPLVADSDAPPPVGEAAATPFARKTAAVRRLAGGTLTVRQDPRGMIEGFEGVEALRARMVQDLAAEDPSRADVDRLLQTGSLMSMLAPGLKVPMEMTRVGPPLRIYDIRPMPECSGVPGLLYYRGEFRLAEVKDGVARVEVNGDVLLDPPDPKLPGWPGSWASFRPLLRLDQGKFHGSARIRLETGTLEEDEHVTEVDLVYLKADGSGEIPIPATRTQTTRLLR